MCNWLLILASIVVFLAIVVHLCLGFDSKKDQEIEESMVLKKQGAYVIIQKF